jgi:hypothetical protein
LIEPGVGGHEWGAKGFVEGKEAIVECILIVMSGAEVFVGVGMKLSNMLPVDGFVMYIGLLSWVDYYYFVG